MWRIDWSKKDKDSFIKFVYAGKDDLNVTDSIEPVKDSSGNIIYRMSDTGNNCR